MIQPISQIAQKMGAEFALMPYGEYVAKIRYDAFATAPVKGKLILVTAITPTPLGEGKTVNTIGLSQALNQLGHPTIACIRQPSLGPVFGVKGGAAGGGAAEVVPTEQLNLHLTGDIHAITSAHNLAAAALDSRWFHENRLGDRFTEESGLPRLNIDKDRIVWGHVLDMNDRALRRIRVGLEANSDKNERADYFEITAASELMAILALTTSLQDMRQRIGNIILAYSTSGEAITAEQLGVAGAMTVLMKNTIHPNLMQTVENTPALIHAGPFANIAHGNSSVMADRIALRLADYAITEAGFGSDMGMEKFFNIKYRQSGIAPSCVVLVATVRSLKANSGLYDIAPGQPLPKAISESNVELLRVGAANLGWHIQNAKSYGVPVVVAINRFPTDSQEELDFLKTYALEQGAFACDVSEVFAQGGQGGEALAKAIIQACDTPSEVTLPYSDDETLEAKIHAITQKYGATECHFSEQAIADIAHLKTLKLDHLPICMVKTPLSISADPKLKNVPTDFTVDINRIEVSAGAGFIRVYTGSIMTMPGLGITPSYLHIDIDEQGQTVGLS